MPGSGTAGGGVSPLSGTVVTVMLRSIAPSEVRLVSAVKEAFVPGSPELEMAQKLPRPICPMSLPHFIGVTAPVRAEPAVLAWASHWCRALSTLTVVRLRFRAGKVQGQ